MLCKVTSKNQLTLPKEIVEKFKNREYFDARVEDGKIVLEPMIVRPAVSERLREIREKVSHAKVSEKDVSAIIDKVRRAARS